MSGQGGPALLSDYSPVEDGGTLALCREMQEKIGGGRCRLVDLLEPRPGEGPRSPQDVRLVEQSADGTWRTRNYVGLFQLGEARVVITSRFDQPDKPFFLYYLLETCWDAALLLLESLSGARQRDLFDLLLAARLAVKLQKAWKKGMLRQYRSFAHNDSRVRGPIDVPRHIRENLGQDNGRVAYRTRAYSLDNPYNVLTLQAADAVERKYPALMRRFCRRLPEFQAALRVLRQESPGWAGVRRETVLRRTDKRIDNPVYQDYEPVRAAARAILRRLGTDPLGEGRRGSVVTGVFLDMDELWERFLAKTLFDGAPGAAQRTRSVLGGHVNVRPDFLWSGKGVVLDAKNRPVWSETLGERTWNRYVREDVYQVLAYMLALDCRNGGLVFPDRDHGPLPPRRDAVGRGSGIWRAPNYLWRVPVYIPRAEDYGTFARRMRAETERLKSAEIIRAVLG